uniref:Reverse transcriptase domain-containing protein n=1 Tax=Salvator merianae TaxID=96440 RepID=A0A8D0C7J8_SALMN
MDKLEDIKNYLEKQNLPQISQQYRTMLNAPITSKELSDVIQGLKPVKSPGPDGFTAFFYKNYIKLLVPKVQILFNDILNNRLKPDSWNKIEIISILKPQKNPVDPGSYRPISLSNKDYKIFTKVLTKRLEEIISRLIKEDQYGFIKNGYIGDPIRNLINVIYHAKKTQ